MASIPMLSVENDGINCTILSSNEMHIFFTRFLSGTYIAHTDKQADAHTKYNLFARKEFSAIHLLEQSNETLREKTF